MEVVCAPKVDRLRSTGAGKAPPAGKEDGEERRDEAGEHVLVLAERPVHEVSGDNHAGNEPQRAVKIEELVARAAQTGGVEAEKLPDAVDDHNEDVLRFVVGIVEAGADDDRNDVADDEYGEQRLDAGGSILPGAARGAAGHIRRIVFPLGEMRGHEIAGGHCEHEQRFARAEKPVAHFHKVTGGLVAGARNDEAGMEADDRNGHDEAPELDRHIALLFDYFLTHNGSPSFCLSFYFFSGWFAKQR